MSTWWCLAFVFALTVAGTFFCRRWALGSGLLDVGSGPDVVLLEGACITPGLDFADGIARTVSWFQEHWK